MNRATEKASARPDVLLWYNHMVVGLEKYTECAASMQKIKSSFTTEFDMNLL